MVECVLEGEVTKRMASRWDLDSNVKFRRKHPPPWDAESTLAVHVFSFCRQEIHSWINGIELRF